jgi:hypothetical protein
VDGLASCLGRPMNYSWLVRIHSHLTCAVLPYCAVETGPTLGNLPRGVKSHLVVISPYFVAMLVLMVWWGYATTGANPQAMVDRRGHRPALARKTKALGGLNLSRGNPHLLGAGGLPDAIAIMPIMSVPMVERLCLAVMEHIPELKCMLSGTRGCL